jgi:L-alanine-DL-glutamate epimerase-like enolase superfamily enzyme
MGSELKITEVKVYQFKFESHNVGTDYNGFNLVYKPDSRVWRTGYVLQIHTDQGVVGEYHGGGATEYAQLEMYVHYLIGRNPLQRELIYNDVKRALRKYDRMSMGHRRKILQRARVGTARRLPQNFARLRLDVSRRRERRP